MLLVDGAAKIIDEIAELANVCLNLGNGRVVRSTLHPLVDLMDFLYHSQDRTSFENLSGLIYL